jgi:hypothetical protein
MKGRRIFAIHLVAILLLISGSIFNSCSDIKFSGAQFTNTDPDQTGKLTLEIEPAGEKNANHAMKVSLLIAENQKFLFHMKPLILSRVPLQRSIF